MHLRKNVWFVSRICNSILQDRCSVYINHISSKKHRGRILLVMEHFTPEMRMRYVLSFLFSYLQFWWSICVKSSKTTTWRWQLSFWRIISQKGLWRANPSKSFFSLGGFQQYLPKRCQHLLYNSLHTSKRKWEKKSSQQGEYHWYWMSGKMKGVNPLSCLPFVLPVCIPCTGPNSTWVPCFT